jgi:hypothetical protein
MSLSEERVDSKSNDALESLLLQARAAACDLSSSTLHCKNWSDMALCAASESAKRDTREEYLSNQTHTACAFDISCPVWIPTTQCVAFVDDHDNHFTEESRNFHLFQAF